MPEHTSPSPTRPALPPLLGALWRLLQEHRRAFRQERTFLRAQALIFGHLFAFARHTITQALVALGLVEGDWSAFYRLFGVPGRLDYEALSGCFFRQTLEHVAPKEPYVAVVDGVQVPRSSHKMPGTSWLKHPRTPPFMPGPHRAQRFLHLAALLPRNPEGYSRALPLRFEPAFPEKAVKAEGFEPKKQWEAALEAIRWLRTNLNEARREEQRLLVVGDGDFSVAELRAQAPEGVVLVTRCAKNRALYELPEEPYEQQQQQQQQRKRRGRRRKYGDRARRPDEWLEERTGWQRVELRVRGRLIHPRYRVEGPYYVVKKAAHRPVFLMVVKGVDRQQRRRWGRGRRRGRRRREPAFWMVSAIREGGRWVMPYSAEELLISWAWQRWEAEVCHREMKTGFGLGEAQCWGPRSAVMAVRWQAWAYGILVLAGFRAWGHTGQPIRPPGRWWSGAKRWSLSTLWRGYRRELWGEREFRPFFTGTGGGWYEKEGWLAGMNNAVWGSLRG